MAEEQTYATIRTVLEPYEAALILLLGFGSMSVALAFFYNFVRRKFYKDSNNLDRSFDAGGKVSFSLTAVTVAVQLLWPADLLQSSNVAAKYGIAGGFWYSTAVVVNIILFPLLSITFKTRAPGAKTYLQVIKARFGKPAHIVYCVFALLTNLVILSVLIIAGHALFKSLVADISDELILLIFATLFGSYSFIGGLGSTFYVSYANAIITFIILCVYIVKLFYRPDRDDLPFGTIGEIYKQVINLEGPAGNEDRNYITFWSEDSLVWAVQGVFVAASVTFCDQASWQSRIAAKPLQGVVGFFFATFIWFAIPATIGTTSGIVYLAYSNGGNNSFAITDDDIDAGLVTPYIAIAAMGSSGGVMVLIMFTMLMMGTGSGEVMGVSSIIVYDIFQSYIYPYRKTLIPGHCILCGKLERGELEVKQGDVQATNGKEDIYTFSNDVEGRARSRHQNGAYTVAVDTKSDERLKELDEKAEVEMCVCTPVGDCAGCHEDLKRMAEAKESRSFAPVMHRCPTHGQYRLYQDSLVRLKSWVVLWVSIGLVPVGLLVVRTGIDLNWIFMTGSVVTIQTFPGVVLSIVWTKTTGIALIIGGIAGLICGVIACLIRAAGLEGGLDEFLLNTSEGYAVMAGACASFFVSLTLGILISLFTHKVKTPSDTEIEWQKLRDVDNPLSPWSNLFREEFPHLDKNERPTFKQLNACFRRAKITAMVGSFLCLILFVFIIPGVMASLHVLTESEFKSFLTTLQVWTLIMAIATIVLVPAEEIRNIRGLLKSRSVSSE